MEKYKGKSLKEMRTLLQAAEENTRRIEHEMGALVRICEDTLRNKTSLFPETNVSALANAIALQRGIRAKPSFFDLFLAEIGRGIRGGHLDMEMAHTLGRYLEEIGYVDSEWYLQINEDVRLIGIPAGAHYIAWGSIEERLPNQFVRPEIDR